MYATVNARHTDLISALKLHFCIMKNKKNQFVDNEDVSITQDIK